MNLLNSFLIFIEDSYLSFFVYLSFLSIYSKIIKETNVSIRAKIQLIYSIRRTIWKNVFILPNN